MSTQDSRLLLQQQVPRNATHMPFFTKHLHALPCSPPCMLLSPHLVCIVRPPSEYVLQQQAVILTHLQGIRWRKSTDRQWGGHCTQHM